LILNDKAECRKTDMALDFTIIGAQRAGTTWAFDRLSMHPDVYFPFGKEFNLWNRYETFVTYNRSIIDLYSNRFRSKFAVKNDKTKMGDVSPVYAVMSDLCIEKLYQFYPAVAVIYILRNPILRAYSAKRYSVTHGKIPPDDLRLPEMRRFFSDPGANIHSDYALHVERWQSIADKRQGRPLDVLLYDDLVHSPGSFIKNIASTIGVDQSFYDLIPGEIISARVNSSDQYEIPEELYAEMLAKYRPMIERLQELIGRDLSMWLSPEPFQEQPHLQADRRKSV
jgi:sulfotransferase family protein